MAKTAITMIIDDYVVDTLLPDLVGHDRQPSAFLVYLCLWRSTHGRGAPGVRIALADLAEATGLSKRSVQDALKWLSRRRLVSTARETMTSVPVYRALRPWRR
jgi:hypothetical protein